MFLFSFERDLPSGTSFPFVVHFGDGRVSVDSWIKANEAGFFGRFSNW